MRHIIINPVDQHYQGIRFVDCLSAINFYRKEKKQLHPYVRPLRNTFVDRHIHVSPPRIIILSGRVLCSGTPSLQSSNPEKKNHQPRFDSERETSLAPNSEHLLCTLHLRRTPMYC